jgi:hypothetical protein
MSKSRFIVSKLVPSRVLSAVAVCLLLAGWSGVASADEASCDAFEIKASNAGNSIDAELKPLEKKLKKPPFSAWKSFKLVKKHSVKAALMKSVTLKLSTGGTLGLLYKERSDAKGRKPRLRVVMTLDDAKGKRKADITLKFDSGDFSLVGQDAGKDGSSRVLAIRCSVK